MTSTVSFKDKVKQIFSVLLWDLKGCKGSLLVYSILASVFTVIIFTLVFVIADSSASFALDGASSKAITVTQKMQVFQVISSAFIGLLTLIFTIIYTVQIFSYMHNKRKVDFYGSLPISRARLYLAKCGAAYLFSIVPMLVFMGIISIVSICTGTLMMPEVVNMYINFIVGTLACVSAYGFLSACCGTTFNTVIMFVAVCVCYPLSMIFVRSYIDAFFTGVYTGGFSDSFIMNALNPISAYFGNNLIYWIIFSIACVALGTLLIMKRRSERAQTSFAYYIPCHIIKVIVSFLAGMFLGTIFGALNVFGNGVGGFVFGFILASATAFLITHMIFYKGLKQLVKTIPIYAGLAVVVIASVALINLDLAGYNSYVPKSEDVKSVGFISSNYNWTGEKIADLKDESAEDFSDSTSIDSVITIHKYILSNIGDEIISSDKFKCVFASMLYNLFGEEFYDNSYTIAYKLNNGKTVTRYYSTLLLSSFYSINDYVSEMDINDLASPIYSTKTYVKKYSALANLNDNSPYITGSLTASALTSSSDESSVGSANIWINTNEEFTAEEQAQLVILRELNDALKKDIEADNTYLDGVLYSPFGTTYYDNYYDDNGYDYYDSSSVNSEDSLNYIRENYSKDYVCKLDIGYRGKDDGKGLLSALIMGRDYNIEYYFVPKTYTNTIGVLQKYGILNSDYTINRNSEFFNY